MTSIKARRFSAVVVISSSIAATFLFSGGQMVKKSLLLTLLYHNFYKMEVCLSKLQPEFNPLYSASL